SRLYSRQALVRDINWFDPQFAQKLDCEVQVRYRQKPVKAMIKKLRDKIEVEFQEPVRAVTEGQSLVCYNGDQLIGGGVIDARK
ncbi:tRNA 2-thiouridine(34) synthase MnmA, partial [Candidatus Berkelbacteria bacterium]|nr:tRNA 2-thiouridine(34) synthase MnmA [Candidatus Berkelbacteria bacterium]